MFKKRKPLIKMGVSYLTEPEHVDYMWTTQAVTNLCEAMQKFPTLAPGMVCSFALETLWIATLSDENYSLAKAIIPRLKNLVDEYGGEQKQIIWESVRGFTHGKIDWFKR